MRRPLFIVCLCFVAAVALRLSPLFSLGVGKQNLSTLPAVGERVIITGEVYQKDTRGVCPQSFRIQSVEQSIFLSAAKSRQTIPIYNNLICETESLEDIRLGCIITLEGRYEPYKEATNPGEFDAMRYYETQGICGRLVDITVLAVSETYSPFHETLYQVKCYFKERLYRIFPEKEASVMTAMLLGDKQELDGDIKELYMENGMVHILSISGLHITMIGMGVYNMLRLGGVPSRIAACLGAMVLVLYGILTGMSVSACRAIGMYLIRMLAVMVGRTYDMLTALGVLAVILVVQNPGNLSHAGFLLSFGSILGVGLLYPVLSVGKEKQLAKPLQSLLAGASITLFTLPIQLWFYYEVPTYSILINWLVLPFMSIVMATGLVAMLLPGGGIVGTITYLILQGYEWLCHMFNQLPFHTWNPGKPNLWQVALYYMVLGILIFFHVKERNVVTRNIRYVYVPILLTVAVSVLILPVQVGNRVTFLDVGQGDGMVLETVTGEVFVFDCGSSNKRQLGKYMLLPFLKYRGIRHIDAIFVSHADTDHYSGIKELLESRADEGISVGQLVLPAIDDEVREEEFAELIRVAKEATQEKPIRISYIDVGERFATEEVSFLCLHPPKGYATENSNAYSQCFYVEWCIEETSKMSLLLTGDVESEGEALLLGELKKRDIENVTVLKVAHHGSGNTTSEAFLEQVKPQAAIISCGEDNSYGHPHEETLMRLEKIGARILTTSEYGAITIEIDKEIKVFGFREILRTSASRFGYD